MMRLILRGEIDISYGMNGRKERKEGKLKLMELG
jgi:hypothetical protein